MSKKTEDAPPDVPSRPVSVADWKKRVGHRCVLESGSVVTIRFPDLSFLLAQGAVPEHLTAVAIQHVLHGIDPAELGGTEGKPLNMKLMSEVSDLNLWMVSWMLLEPKIEHEQLRELVANSELPAEDLDLLVALANRNRDTDAEGTPLGVTAMRRLERFRDVRDGIQLAGDEADPEDDLVGV